jgi:hypothetical protein
MRTFIAVDDELLAGRILAASDRIIFVAPAVSKAVAAALGACFRKADRVSITSFLIRTRKVTDSATATRRG